MGHPTLSKRVNPGGVHTRHKVYGDLFDIAHYNQELSLVAIFELHSASRSTTTTTWWACAIRSYSDQEDGQNQDHHQESCSMTTAPAAERGQKGDPGCIRKKRTDRSEHTSSGFALPWLSSNSFLLLVTRPRSPRS